MPFIEVFTDFMSRGQEKYESAPQAQHLLYIPLQCAFVVIANTNGVRLRLRKKKLDFILSYFSAYCSTTKINHM